MAGEIAGRISVDRRDRLADELAITRIRHEDGRGATAHIVDRRFDLRHAHSCASRRCSAELSLKSPVPDIGDIGGPSSWCEREKDGQTDQTCRISFHDVLLIFQLRLKVGVRSSEAFSLQAASLVSLFAQVTRVSFLACTVIKVSTYCYNRLRFRLFLSRFRGSG